MLRLLVYLTLGCRWIKRTKITRSPWPTWCRHRLPRRLHFWWWFKQFTYQPECCQMQRFISSIHSQQKDEQFRCQSCHSDWQNKCKRKGSWNIRGWVSLWTGYTVLAAILLHPRRKKQIGNFFSFLIFSLKILAAYWMWFGESTVVRHKYNNCNILFCCCCKFRTWVWFLLWH